MNILFRADSSSTIGTGHIMRDLVLAEQFENADIIFATQELFGNVNNKIAEKNYVSIILNSNDIEELDRYIKEYDIDMIVIDHYGIDYDFEKRLKTQNTKLKIFSLDDTYEKHYCDILLNHNISANPTKYKDLVPKKCELRCGAKYTLIRNEFIKEKTKKRKKSKKNEKTIFIAMGGSDHSNITLKILKSIPKVYKIHIATTDANKNLKKLKQFTLLNKMIKLHINSNNIARLIRNSDIAIISPSVISHEVLYMQVPFISILTGDDQKDIYKYLKNKQLITMKKFNSKKLTNNINNLNNNLKKYKKNIKRIIKK